MKNKLKIIGFIVFLILIFIVLWVLFLNPSEKDSLFPQPEMVCYYGDEGYSEGEAIVKGVVCGEGEVTSFTTGQGETTKLCDCDGIEYSMGSKDVADGGSSTLCVGKLINC